jgi:O-antigen ligase
MTIAPAYPVADAGSHSWPRRLGFITAVLMVLTFSQSWQTPLVGPGGDPEASTLIRSLFLPAYGMAAILLLMRPWKALATALRSPLIWLLLALVFASCAWSIDPGTTWRRSVALLFTTLAALFLASRFKWPEMLEVLAAAFAVVAACCYLLGLFVPAYGRMSDLFPGAWRGVYSEKNALGDTMTMAFITFTATAVLNPARRWLWIGFAAAAVGLVLLSTSKTSLVTLLIGSACLGFVWLARRPAAVSIAATFAAVTGLVGLGIGLLWAPDAFLALLGKDETLTGRTVIWTSVLRIIRQRPWTGYGYGSIWTDESGWGPLAWIIKWSHFRPRHAHNSWLETWLALGYPGLLLWGSVFILTCALTLAAAYRRPCGYFALPFLVFYGLTTLTESVAFIYNDLYWVIFAAVAFKLAAGDRIADAGEDGAAAPP